MLYHHPIEAAEGIILVQNNSTAPQHTHRAATGLCQYWHNSSPFHQHSLPQTTCVPSSKVTQILLSGENCIQVKLQ